MEFRIRKATRDDVPRIAEIVEASVRGLARGIYSERQIELSINSVFGVDTELIDDGTYFVAESDGEIGGCGGWSRRKTLYGASGYADSRDSEMLDPTVDAAKIRAFFIHPDWARRGIGTAILDACEAEALAEGFSTAEMMSTLPGVPLYSARGYAGDERVAIPIGDGETIECVRMRKGLHPVR
jgi:GNAT superfamily N-acetyltransferase